ncbi:MAG: hypothetical protein KC535_05295, partial [Nanoarchaeota archaeon]|nr:hypothetical protein [Nanoarchaeota archaeon]
YLILNFWLNEVATIGFRIFSYRLYITIPFIIFTIINAALISISINMSIHRFSQLRNFSVQGTSLSVIGTFFALLTGACPGCIAGFFPVIMGIIGSSLTLNQLPLYGLELQLLSVLILLTGIYLLSKPMTCKAPVKK